MYTGGGIAALVQVPKLIQKMEELQTVDGSILPLKQQKILLVSQRMIYLLPQMDQYHIFLEVETRIQHVFTPRLKAIAIYVMEQKQSVQQKIYLLIQLETLTLPHLNLITIVIELNLKFNQQLQRQIRFIGQTIKTILAYEDQMPLLSMQSQYLVKKLQMLR